MIIPITKKTRPIAYLVSFITAIFFSAAMAISWAAEETTELAPKQASLGVTYDQEYNLLSIQDHGVLLGRVIKEIDKKTDLTVKSLKENLLEAQISLDLERLSLEQAMKKLLQGINTAFYYSPAPAEKRIPATSHLVKVLLLSKKGSMPADTTPTREAPSSETQLGVTQMQTPSKGVELIRAIAANKQDLARDIVKALGEKGTKKEIEEAVDALLDAMLSKVHADDSRVERAYFETIAALRELAPERAVNPLVDLLQNEENETRVRILAASGLGEVGQESAVGPLMWAFDGNDPLVREFAATSLAQIGGQRGVDFLVEALSTGDINFQQTAVIALGLQGNDQAKAALRQAIADGQVAQQAIPKDVAEELARRKDSTN